VLWNYVASVVLSVKQRDDSDWLANEGRNVLVSQSRYGNATGWCKEVKTALILNLSVTLRRLFHRVFNVPVEK